MKHTVRRNNKKPMVSHKSRYNISIISPWKLPNIWNNTPKKHSLVVAISYWWPSRSYWLFDVLYWQSNFSYCVLVAYDFECDSKKTRKKNEFWARNKNNKFSDAIHLTTNLRWSPTGFRNVASVHHQPVQVFFLSYEYII